MGLSDTFASAWDRVEEEFTEAKAGVRRGVAQARAAFEKRVDDAWESPTERRLKADNSYLEKELADTRERVNRFMDRLDTANFHRNALAVVALAAVITAVVVLIWV